VIHAQRASGFILLLVIFTCANAAAQDYYKSKFIRFIVGQAAGGGYDTYTRTIARHIVNHIPGNPGVTVE
jgi:tripartite-type tricarboxylate transporter receptor subunit TctC